MGITNRLAPQTKQPTNLKLGVRSETKRKYNTTKTNECTEITVKYKPSVTLY